MSNNLVAAAAAAATCCAAGAVTQTHMELHCWRSGTTRPLLSWAVRRGSLKVDDESIDTAADTKTADRLIAVFDELTRFMGCGFIVIWCRIQTLSY